MRSPDPEKTRAYSFGGHSEGSPLWRNGILKDTPTLFSGTGERMLSSTRVRFMASHFAYEISGEQSRLIIGRRLPLGVFEYIQVRRDNLCALLKP
mmetsp:Transcript_24506/g.61187  ORF Transcript_24506/g.61187 Transcript_24506/m.61187 type:complete len:95 (-) Transcript_24506:158-442(-)